MLEPAASRSDLWAWHNPRSVRPKTTAHENLFLAAYPSCHSVGALLPSSSAVEAAVALQIRLVTLVLTEVLLLESERHVSIRISLKICNRPSISHQSVHPPRPSVRGSGIPCPCRPMSVIPRTVAGPHPTMHSELSPSNNLIRSTVGGALFVCRLLRLEAGARRKLCYAARSCSAGWGCIDRSSIGERRKTTGDLVMSYLGDS